MMASSSSFSLESEIIQTKPHQPIFSFSEMTIWPEEVSGKEFPARECLNYLVYITCSGMSELLSVHNLATILVLYWAHAFLSDECIESEKCQAANALPSSQQQDTRES